MKTLQDAIRPAAFLFILALLLGPAACAIEGGYASGPPAVSVGVGLEYYEPFGYDYGGWGPDYYVGPARGGPPHGSFGPGRGFRPAPPGRPIPSIPTAVRRAPARPTGDSRR